MSQAPRQRRRIRGAAATQLPLFGRPGPASEGPRESPEPRAPAASSTPSPEPRAGRSEPRRPRPRGGAQWRSEGPGPGPGQAVDPEPASREPAPRRRAEPLSRPFPLTAVECERDTMVSPLTYVGFVTHTGRVVCGACLDTNGAVRSLAGERFARYLWRTSERTRKRGVERCAVCDAAVEHEVSR